MNINNKLILLIFGLGLIIVRVLTITELSISNFFLTQNYVIPIFIGLCIDFYCLKSRKAPKWLIYFITFLSIRSLFHTSNNDVVILFSSLMILSNVLSWKGINTFATFLVSFWLTYNYETSFIGILDVLSHNILSYLVLMSFILMCLVEKRNYLIKDKQTIVFAILASCYFSSFIAKFIMPDNSFVNYLKLNDMSNLITAAVINRSNILPISFLGSFLYSLGSFFFLFGKIGKAINYFIIPFENYSQVPHYKNKSKDWLIRCGVMVTFDYLSPKYDSPIRPSIMKKISKKHLNPKNIDFEVYTDKGTTLLRSLA
jgi:hypothetical protein